MEKDSLSHTDQQYECMAEIGEVPAYRKVFKDCNLKNGSPFLTLKHLGVQTSEEGMRLSTIHEVAVLRHLENWSTGSWSVEPGALAMGSRKGLGKGLLVAQLKLRVEFPEIKPGTLLDSAEKSFPAAKIF